MLPYFLILSLIIIFGSGCQCNPTLVYGNDRISQKKKNKVCIVIISIILILFSGLRYEVGSDWFAYFYSTHASFKKSLNNSYVEIGWKLFGYIITAIYDQFGIVMFITSIITIIFFIKKISIYSPNVLISLLLFFFLDYDNSFNAVRQYLAASILFFGHRAILEKKFLKWILFVAVATSFHTTSIVMFFCYFLVNRSINLKQIIILLFFVIFSLTSYDNIFNFIAWYKNSNRDLSTNPYTERTINIFRVMIHWVPVFFYFTFIHVKQTIQFNKEINFYSNFTILCAAVMTATCNSAYLGRMTVYFSTYVALAIPLMTDILNKKNKIMFNTIFIIFYGIYWLINLVTHPSLYYNKIWIFQ